VGSCNFKGFHGNTYSHPLFINKSLKVKKHVAFHEGPISKYFCNKRKKTPLWDHLGLNGHTKIDGNILHPKSNK
jgi:hypothetical protein